MSTTTMIRPSWGAALVASVVALCFAVPAAGAASVEGLCPQTTAAGAPAPEASCVPEAVPGEGWTIAGIEPVSDPAKLAVYRAILAPYGAYYVMPSHPALGYVGVRLNVGSFSTGTADPGQGYQEMEIAIRVLEKQTGEVGWFPLATAVNNSSEYSAGRLVGFPKYMADETITHNATSKDWTYTSSPPGKDSEFFQTYSWSPASPGPVSSADAAELSRFDLYQEAMFTVARPWDENDPNWFPVRNMFTVTPLVPFTDTVPGGLPATGTPLDADVGLPPTQLGTFTVNISQTIGPASLSRFRGLLDTDANGNPVTVTVPGMFWHGNGWVFITSERLDGQPGLPGKYQTGPNYGLGGPPLPAVPQNAVSSRRTTRAHTHSHTHTKRPASRR